MPVPKFPTNVLNHAVAIRRGTKSLMDVPKDIRPAVQDAMRRDSIIMTHLRLQNPKIEVVTPKPHFRGV